MKCLYKKATAIVTIFVLTIVVLSNLTLVQQNERVLGSFNNALESLSDNIKDLTIVSSPTIENTVEETIYFNTTTNITNDFNPTINIDDDEHIIINDDEYITINDDEEIVNYIDINNNINITDSENNLEVITLPNSDEVLFQIDSDYYAYFAVSKDARESMLTKLRENTWYITGDSGCTFKIVDGEIIVR